MAIAGGILAIAWLGSSANAPGMVLVRGVLGVRGAWPATALNVAQNVGWAIFETIVIAHAARASAGGGPLALWTVLAAAAVTALALVARSSWCAASCVRSACPSRWSSAST